MNAQSIGRLAAIALAGGLYMIVHLISLNPMLLVAALVCGLYWGAIRQWRGSVVPGLLSHILWDITIFVLLPMPRIG